MPLSIKVKKELGEEVRAILVENDLLNSDYRIKKETNYLIIPIKRELEEKLFGDILKIDNKAEIINKDLERAIKAPNSHVEILESILTPEQMELVPRSFDTIGDIVIVEIPEEIWDKKTNIGKAFLEAYSSIKSVFVKSGKIEGINRIRPVEFLVGENKTSTIYKEHGCRYKVDIVKAYFSPRLSEEHNRIAKKASNNEIIVDLFCGIGPFAIPIAKRNNVIIHAIDINPGAIELLNENIKLNKLIGKIIPYCGDCRKVVEENKLENIADRVIMNLPGYAIEFIDVACKVLKSSGGIIHFFEFVGGDDPEQTIIDDLSREVERFGRKIEKILEVRKVRMSAPRQWQMVVDALIK
ncbi:MAG: class I SAM-dependent methyltransferase family protein [Asgard group archaeon]|nr:class I SAM-dependent methyltransferase family protein [Asgard group archaeon]